MKNKLRVGILGATGMVGQRFITLLENHPWFEVAAVAASARSAGKLYREAVGERWAQKAPIPPIVADLLVQAVDADSKIIASNVDFVFSAIEADKEAIKRLEETYAGLGLPVVSNNSAHRSTPDVPMIMPEINPEHLAMIERQRQNRGWKKGLIVVKPNCSIQSVVPLLKAWEAWAPKQAFVSTYQALSGAGKTLATWPEMEDNVIPLISGEEEKTEHEPLKILSHFDGKNFIAPAEPTISATCVRVPVSDGHLVSLFIRFAQKASKDELIEALRSFHNPLKELGLPSAPQQLLTYFEEENRPQTKLDRDLEKGMGISVGRLRPDPLFDWKCVALSHNTIRGAAGGAILVAELLHAKGFI